jgi:hypothetical protein
MSLSDPACFHTHTRVEDMEQEMDPETGYRDRDTLVTCLDCDSKFTAEEYQRELDQLTPRPGDVFEQFGLRLVVIDAGGDDLWYCSRDGAYTGPLRSVRLDHFFRLLRKGIVTRVTRGSAIK